MTKVSVIIPTYNGEKYIAETINSILNQTFKDFEIIVVDDGSNDRTCAIVASYASVRLITQANAGVCAARNRGIREAAGEFICLMDHDDYWFAEKLARQIEEFQSHAGIGAIYSSFINWHATTNGQFPAPDSFNRTTSQDDIDHDFSGWIYHLFLLDCWMLTSTAMFRAEVFRQCGVFDETLPYSEDWDLWLRIAREYPMIKLRRPTTLYRQHEQQGNRIIRNVDYRTMLLIRAVKKWGFCSDDGRCITRRQFFDQLATYHTSFAIGHLQCGRRVIAIHSFISAWLCSPQRLKYLACILAALLGWSPK